MYAAHQGGPGAARKKHLNGFKYTNIPEDLVSDYTGALQPDAWEKELPQDYKHYGFIIEGVKNGFHLVTEKGFKVVEQDNYGSALTNAKLVEKEIKNEITEGRYIIVKEKPTIVSALGAVIKKSGSARIIHDGSKPEGYSLNSFAVLHEKKKMKPSGMQKL